MMPHPAPSVAGRTLGIIGGGQLGRMLVEAAQGMTAPGGGGGVSGVVVLDPTRGCPAAQAGAEQIVAGFRDKDAITELARRCDVITYEIESGDSDVLASLEDMVEINPSPATLRIIQDKLLQKKELERNGIGVAEFEGVGSEDGLLDSAGRLGYPMLLKARRDGYDGRGNYKVDSRQDVAPAYGHFGGRPLLVERFVPFRMEISVIAARNTVGEIATYPPVENIHEDSILRTTIAPARIGSDLAADARQLAEKTMTVLRGAGVFGIEMFVTRGDALLINEIAPRVHNSGHHTLQSSKTSQFEQHLRAILGMPLGDTALVRPTVMYNVLGDAGFEGRYTAVDPPVAGSTLKMYGKEISKPKRKMGHVNITDDAGQDSQQVPLSPQDIGWDKLLARLDEVARFDIIRPASAAAT